MKCPRCGECPFPKGVCERVASRGRRFFLMGALALPVAVAIERIKPIVEPEPQEVAHYVYSAEAFLIYRHIDMRYEEALGTSTSPWIVLAT